jgi:hypothetical protein
MKTHGRSHHYFHFTDAFNRIGDRDKGMKILFPMRWNRLARWEVSAIPPLLKCIEPLPLSSPKSSIYNEEYGPARIDRNRKTSDDCGLWPSGNSLRAQPRSARLRLGYQTWDVVRTFSDPNETAARQSSRIVQRSVINGVTCAFSVVIRTGWIPGSGGR